MWRRKWHAAGSICQALPKPAVSSSHPASGLARVVIKGRNTALERFREPHSVVRQLKRRVKRDHDLAAQVEFESNV
jgi:hypothetical protein